MAHTKSQQKRIRQDRVRAARNRAIRSEIRTRTRRIREAVEAGESATAEEGLRAVQKRLDQAVAKGVIKKNTASRRKSKLYTLVRSQ